MMGRCLGCDDEDTEDTDDEDTDAADVLATNARADIARVLLNVIAVKGFGVLLSI